MAARYAWYGRVSTEDEQDPTLSFPRQLNNSERQVAESGGLIVAHFYDVESGTCRYDARGSGGLSGFNILILRDGGLHDLLQTAKRRPLAFDRVIVESISRLSRNSSVAFRIEEELSACGVRLCAADEPLEESFGTIVLRHVNIGIARGYHHELMIKSRQGSETSIKQGWHTGGIAPYGYRFLTHPHPNPHKAKRGDLKRTLELDPVRASVVRRIFDLYLSGTAGVKQLQDVLNADLDNCPSPRKPDPTQSNGSWSRSSIWEILRNPKYTGYQVWNRRARKKGGRPNDPSAWVWSDEPSHPAIISRAEFEAVGSRARTNHRSYREPGTPPKTAYLYRSILRCGACGNRMWGKTRPSGIYYQCQVTHQRSANMPPGHPATVHLSEAKLNPAVLDFLATAVFGPEREAYWRYCLETAFQPEAASPNDERVQKIETEISDLETRLERQILSLEAEDADPAFRRRIAQRIGELDQALVEKRRLRDQLAAQAPAPAPRFADVAGLLAKLPLIAEKLHELPTAELRRLFEALQLTVTYHHARKEADIEITLHNGGLDGAQVCTVPPVRFELTLWGF